METICEACNTKLMIPDHKLPQTGKFMVSCPKCKNRLSVAQPKQDGLNPSPPSAVGTPLTQKGSPAPMIREETDSILESLEMDGTLALIMAKDPEQGAKLVKCVEDLGYRPVLTSNTRDAVSKIRLHHFDLLMLSEGFDSVELLQSPILDHLNHLSMSIRRKMFLVLVSDAFMTADNMMAFSMSANLVVNPKSLDKLSSILQRAQKENRLFYKVFFDVLEETGKA
jgi:predicted Zn finger-like uncharacterized protein